MGTRSWIRSRVVGLALAVLSTVAVAYADSDVPVNLQVQLIGKLATFDRNLPNRAGGTVRILVVNKNGDGKSTRVANEISRGLGAFADIAGLPKEVIQQPFTNGADLAAACKQRRLSVIYVAPGLEGDMAGIAAALNGIDVMTVGPTGAVIGFELEESKPRIIVDLTRAKSQNVALRAEILKLVRIVH